MVHDDAARCRGEKHLVDLRFASTRWNGKASWPDVLVCALFVVWLVSGEVLIVDTGDDIVVCKYIKPNGLAIACCSVGRLVVLPSVGPHDS
jgi:hypothetical protein